MSSGRGQKGPLSERNKKWLTGSLHDLAGVSPVGGEKKRFLTAAKKVLHLPAGQEEPGKVGRPPVGA